MARTPPAANQKGSQEAQHPTIHSLASFRVPISDDVFHTLCSQYEDASRFHSILDHMKIPPRQTVLRLKQPYDSRQERISHLQVKVKTWLRQEGAHGLIQSHVGTQPILDDVITIDLEQVTGDSSGYHTRIKNLYTETTPDPERYPVIFPDSPQRKDRGWPLTHRVVIVDRLCGEAVLRGADVFVRGILAADHGIQPTEKVAVYADLNSRIPKGLAVDKYTGECIFLGVGQSYCSRAYYFSQAQGRGIRLSALPCERAGPVLPPLDDWLNDGSLFSQNLPSIVVGHVLAPKPGECIYDMCAAPGGKTSHIARLTNFQATIVMSDKSRRKVITAKRLFQDLGCDSCVVPLHIDGTASVDERADMPRKSVRELISTAETDADGLLKIKKFFPESFDRILLDPPCSALGLRPKLQLEQKTEKDLMSFVKYQERFAGQAVRLTKPGGLLVYSTCTMHARENEGMVQYILDNYPDMELVPIVIPLGSPGLPGHGISSEDCPKVRRFDPTVSDTMSFFVAAFTKRYVLS